MSRPTGVSQYLLAPSDVPSGWHKISETDAGGSGPITICDAVSETSRYSPASLREQAQAAFRNGSGPLAAGNSMDVIQDLGRYAGTDAISLLSALSTASRECDGQPFTLPTSRATVTIRPIALAGLGDESVAFAVNYAGGRNQTKDLAAVRVADRVTILTVVGSGGSLDATLVAFAEVASHKLR